MKHEITKMTSIHRNLPSLTWTAVFVVAMSFMTAYVIAPVLDEWLSHTTGWLLGAGSLSAFAVIAGLMLSVLMLSVCFVLSY